jgi:hypothetical protein
MFQFTYKLKVAERVKGKCERHPRYNPERGGPGGIKGGCSTCFSLFDLHQARLSLDAAHREFLRRATPWSHVSAKLLLIWFVCAMTPRSSRYRG